MQPGCWLGASSRSPASAAEGLVRDTPIFFVCHVAGPTRLAESDFVQGLSPKWTATFRAKVLRDAFVFERMLAASALLPDMWLVLAVAWRQDCFGHGTASPLNMTRLDTLADMRRRGHRRLVPAAMAAWWRQAKFCLKSGNAWHKRGVFRNQRVDLQAERDIRWTICQETIRRFWKIF